MLEDRVDNVTPGRKPRGVGAAAEIPLAQLKSRKWRNTIIRERAWQHGRSAGGRAYARTLLGTSGALCVSGIAREWKITLP